MVAEQLQRYDVDDGLQAVSKLGYLHWHPCESSHRGRDRLNSVPAASISHLLATAHLQVTCASAVPIGDGYANNAML